MTEIALLEDLNPLRPPESNARLVIEEWLIDILGQVPSYRLSEDGEDSWAFLVCAEDTTSYLHSDMTVEWYGTIWDETYSEEELMAKEALCG